MRTLLLTLAATLAFSAPAGATPLTVGVSLPSEGFQVGVADGTRVLYAEGFEIDLARELAVRLGSDGAAFVQSPFETLVAPGVKPWDLALAEITITPGRAAAVDFSAPYLRVDQGVLVSQYVRTTPRTIRALRSLKLCAARGTTGADAIAARVKPRRRAALYPDVPALTLALQLGRCDAAVFDLPVLTRLKDRAPRRFGSLAGRITTDERYGVALPKGSPLTGRVNTALSAITSDGTLARLQRTWFDVAPTEVRTLR